MNSKSIVLILFFTVIGVFFFNSGCSNSGKKQTESFNTATDFKYVGSDKCKTCHSNEFVQWQSSHHFKAMQAANETTVAGDFNDKAYSADGITSHFFKKGDYFYINTQGDDGKYYDYKIDYTDRKSTRLNSSHVSESRMPSSA